jgi:putative lipoic acid-binding regulatory protein
MDQPPLDLLEANHFFPGVYQIKAIGSADEGFEARVLEAVRGEVSAPSDVAVSVRSTPGGRHVALTLDITVQSADQVRQIYVRIREQKGLLFLL